MKEQKAERTQLSLEDYVIQGAELIRIQGGRQYLTPSNRYTLEDAPRITGKNNGDEMNNFKSAVRKVLVNNGYPEIEADYNILESDPDAIKAGIPWCNIVIFRNDNGQS